LLTLILIANKQKGLLFIKIKIPLI